MKTVSLYIIYIYYIYIYIYNIYIYIYIYVYICVCVLCAFSFFVQVVVAIFDIRTIFMNCPPPCHSIGMPCFFVVCVHFFLSDYRIFVYFTYISVKIGIFMMRILKKKSGACFFFVGIKERKEIYISTDRSSVTNKQKTQEE